MSLGLGSLYMIGSGSRLCNREMRFGSWSVFKGFGAI